MDRRQKGLNPVLPEAAEREKIKAEYMKSQPKITVHTKASWTTNKFDELIHKVCFVIHKNRN